MQRISSSTSLFFFLFYNEIVQNLKGNEEDEDKKASQNFTYNIELKISGFQVETIKGLKSNEFAMNEKINYLCTLNAVHSKVLLLS